MKINGQITLKSIAEKFGVSVSTVSRILSGKARQYRISEKTEKLVQDEADKIGFAPNKIASALRLQKTHTFGLIIPDISNPFFAAIARHVEMEARKRDYFIILCDAQENTQTEIESIRLLQSRSIDGLIISPVGQIGKHLKELRDGGMPVVLVDRYFPNLEIPFVTSENREGAFKTVNYLIEKGHRKIACIKGLSDSSTSNDRVDGYKQALEKNGIAINESFILGDDFGEENGYSKTKVLLEGKEKPTAIFSLGNLISLGAMRAIAEAGLSIPSDISLVSFDDYDYAAFLSTPLTTVAQQTEEMGKIAVKLLYDQLDESEKKMERVSLPTKLIKRDSVCSLDK